MHDINFEEHNEEVKEVWRRFDEGNPVRVPIIFGVSARYMMFNDDANPNRISFEEYTNDPDVMFERQLENQYWLRHNVPQDAEMGLPKDGWRIHVDFQNFYEAAWLGCQIEFRDNEVPDTRPLLAGDRKDLLFERGIPDPFEGGLMKRNKEYYEYFLEKKEGYTFHGLPVVGVSPCGLGTDGPLTVAASLRGATELFTDFYEDPEYVHKLLGYITDATIARIQAWRKYLGQDLITDSWGFADDSIELISVETYREFVLPYHKKLINTFSRKGPNGVHLCGDASRHFKTMKYELNITSFDTGFPIDLAEMRRVLGPDVRINGGVHVQLLRQGPTTLIREEVKRILSSGVMEGGKFVLRDANNLAPHTPLEHLWAMYNAGKEFGRYDEC